ncbi:MAG: FecR domain-containing protein [Chloroflexota bacterium]|nr:FecR domain-containing protein [Chloroflexota bacterium]
MLLQRVRFLAGTVVLAMLMGLGLGVTGVFVSSAKAYSASTSLTVLSGDVSVRHGVGDFVAARDGDVLSEGDTIRTSPDARAVLTYFEGSTVTIEPSSLLTIDNASTLADGSTVVVMTQSLGRTWHVVTKLVTGFSKYEVKTPASTASVRGTQFQVDADATATTVTTTEGTVLAHVDDPSGGSVDVPVTAGTAQTQMRHAAPAPAHKAAEPERKVTVTVNATNSIVVDPAGRSNGVTKDGKVVVQTPGAQVRREGNTIVITLPNLPDGRLAAHVEKQSPEDDDDVQVGAKVEDKGDQVDLKDSARSDGIEKTTGFELKRTNGKTETRTLDEREKQALPEVRVTAPKETVVNGPNGTRRVVPVTPTQRPAVVPTRKPANTKAPAKTPAPSTRGEGNTTPALPVGVTLTPTRTPSPRG